MLEDIAALFEVAEKVTLRGFMFAAIVGFIRGWWVPGQIYRKAVETGDKWREIALRVTRLGERHVGIDEKLDRLMADEGGR